MPSIGYLGPPGTFTHEALRVKIHDRYEKEVPLPTIMDVLMAVEDGELECGLVPIENSIEGTVNVTVDTLTFETDLLIENEAVLRIKLCLAARPGVSRDDLEGIISHPHATAQCIKYLAEKFPGIHVTAANSTADAAMIVSESERPLAAIASEFGARTYGLEVLEREIEDHPFNMTRFIVVGKGRPTRTGKDKTTVVCFIKENRPGSLLEILEEFARRGINLTKIESRPTKKVLGEYYFFIDMEGHAEESHISEALRVLEGKLRKLKFLGSYPKADLEIEYS